MPTLQDVGDRYVFGNSDGTFTIWKDFTFIGDLVVGPGYIGRSILRTNSDVVCDGFVPHDVSMNDPRWQGMLGVAWHHFRQIPGEGNIWNKGWEMASHKSVLSSSDPFGVSEVETPVAPYINASGEVRASFLVNFVDRYSAAEGKRIMAVRYDYIVDDSQVKCWVTFVTFPDGFDSGPSPFIKEPKVAIGAGGNTYKPHTLDVFRADSSLLRSIDLINDPKLQDPSTGTIQVGFDTRTRMRFYDSKNYFNIVARGNLPLSYGADGKPIDYKTWSRADWEGGDGLDRWAVLSDSRAEFDPSVCASYCKQGGKGTGPGFLTRQWEVAKRGTESQTEIMFHGWEGGSGLPDCLCCAKALVAGGTHTNFFSVSRDAGWSI